MSFGSFDATKRVRQTTRVIIAVVAMVVVTTITEPSSSCSGAAHAWVAPKVSLPDESVGIDGIVGTL